jgi:hypothetical protein
MTSEPSYKRLELLLKRPRGLVVSFHLYGKKVSSMNKEKEDLTTCQSRWCLRLPSLQKWEK